MKNNSLITLCILCLTTFVSCAQVGKELRSDAETNTIEDSQYLLKHQMKDSLYQTMEGRLVKESDRTIKTKEEAIKLGKQVFFKGIW